MRPKDLCQLKQSTDLAGNRTRCSWSLSGHCVRIPKDKWGKIKKNCAHDYDFSSKSLNRYLTNTNMETLRFAGQIIWRVGNFRTHKIIGELNWNDRPWSDLKVNHSQEYLLQWTPIDGSTGYINWIASDSSSPNRISFFHLRPPQYQRLLFSCCPFSANNSKSAHACYVYRPGVQKCRLRWSDRFLTLCDYASLIWPVTIS
jgi:hypothetical protein